MVYFSDHLPVAQVEPITIIRTGRRGRPRKFIDPEFLQEALKPNRRISVSRLADALNVVRGTVYNYMHMFGIERDWSDITNEDINELIRAYREQRPDSGLRYIMGYIRGLQLRIQRRRLIESQHQVDGTGVALRAHRAARRRTYRVPRPNALWHCDGHHKLIRWGFVIHGFIDGYC